MPFQLSLERPGLSPLLEAQGVWGPLWEAARAGSANLSPWLGSRCFQHCLPSCPEPGRVPPAPPLCSAGETEGRAGWLPPARRLGGGSPPGGLGGPCPAASFHPPHLSLPLPPCPPPQVCLRCSVSGAGEGHDPGFPGREGMLGWAPSPQNLGLQGFLYANAHHTHPPPPHHLSPGPSST